MRRVGVVAVALFALAFLVAGRHHVAAPFGDSHDGRNGTAWGLGSRTIRSQGLVASKLGPRRDFGQGVSQTYADHPSLIYPETAVSEITFGEHTWATRLPALISSLAAMALAFVLLTELGLGSLASAAAVALGFGCPMFSIYGLMLDTWVLGLPWGIAALVLYERHRRGARGHAVLIAAVCIFGALTSWVNVILLGLIVLLELAPLARRRRLRPGAWAWVAFPAIGAAVTFAWIYWALGSFDALIKVFAFRTGGGRETVSLDLLIYSLKRYWQQVMVPWQTVLTAPALAAGWLNRRTRRPFALAFGTLILWVALFRDGAVHHTYWIYWVTLPLAIGLAAAVVEVKTLVPRTSLPILVSGAPARFALLAAAVALGAAGLAAPSIDRRDLTQGFAAGRTVARSHYPPEQTRAWYLGDVIEPTDWLSYSSHRPAQRLFRPVDVDRLAAQHPHDLVLVASYRLTSDLAPVPGAPCRAGVPLKLRYGEMTAAALAAALHSGRCPASRA